MGAQDRSIWEDFGADVEEDEEESRKREQRSDWVHLVLRRPHTCSAPTLCGIFFGIYRGGMRIFISAPVTLWLV